MSEKQLQMDLVGLPQDESPIVARRRWAVEGCLGKPGLHEREKDDFYATDPLAVEWLCEIEQLRHDIWEPACGQGHIAKVLVEHGFNVRSTDLINRGYGQGGVDFFAQTEAWEGDIVTNPPFKYAQEFVEHAMELVKPGGKVCMFMKLQYLEGNTRRKLYDKYPPKRVWVSSSRIKCARAGEDFTGGSMIAFAWYIWEKGYEGETTLKWFN